MDLCFVIEVYLCFIFSVGSVVIAVGCRWRLQLALTCYHINDPLLLSSEEVGVGWGESYLESTQIGWWNDHPLPPILSETCLNTSARHSNLIIIFLPPLHSPLHTLNPTGDISTWSLWILAFCTCCFLILSHHKLSGMHLLKLEESQGSLWCAHRPQY